MKLPPSKYPKTESLVTLLSGKRRKPIKRSVRRVNPKRRKSEFARCYHSKERVEFVKTLPCASCGTEGYSENAHMEKDGMGRKADYTKIAPLCGPHPVPWIGLTMGCHRMFDEFRNSFYACSPDFDAAKAARETQNAWENFAAHRGTPDE